MDSRVAEIIEKNIDAIENNDFDTVYPNIGTDYGLRGMFTRALLDAGIDPLPHMTRIWSRMYQFLTIHQLAIPSNITRIGDNAFERCTQLHSVKLAEGLHVIDYGAFKECFSLQNITFPDSLTTLGGAAFYKCTSFTTIKTPANVDVLNEYCFAECTNLESVIIGPKTEVVRLGVFYGCKKLKEVTIPISVDMIQRNAFMNTGLEHIIYEGTTEDWKRIKMDSVVFPSNNIIVECTDKTVQLKDLQ